jgi:hypothetical protein
MKLKVGNKTFDLKPFSLKDKELNGGDTPIQVKPKTGIVCITIPARDFRRIVVETRIEAATWQDTGDALTEDELITELGALK